MGKRVFLYGERMTIPRTFVRDEITEQPKRREPAQPKKRDPKLEAKLARVVALLERLVAEDRPAVTDGMKFLQDAIRQVAFEAACEGAQAAYAARNPHKAQQKDTAQEKRLQYPHKPRQREPWENRIAAQDSANWFLIMCQESENAYAARNPHKRGK